MFTKGADSVIIPRCSQDNPFKENTIEFSNQFARDGFRTLLLCKRVISESEYNQWLQQYERVANVDVGREAELENVYSLIEKNLILLGSTAIEDKL